MTSSLPCFVAYYRVSTDRQGASGLGLDAQRQAVARQVNGGQLVAEFTEIESGRRHTNRPQLLAALDECRKRRAILLIARLDRLARNVAFIANLMAESCLDDEFNPGDCDLDVGTAVAAVPDSEEIDTFAFSDMSPDYMGFYDVWPGVETDLFQGGVDLDANRADGPGGSAMRNLSDPITIGTIYTDVATPFACHYHENRGEQCDPIWNGQVGAVESTAAPSISSLSPPSAVPNSSGTLAINGDNLLNIFDPAGQPDVTSSSSSVTLSSPTASSPASTSVQVNYSIAADATPGSYDVTASNNWGTSNAAAFTIASGANVQSPNKATPKPAITASPLVTGAGCSGEIVNPTRIVWWGSIIGPYPAGDIECVTTNVMAGQQIYIGVPPVPLLNNNWLNVRNLTWTIYDCSDSNCATKTSTVHAVGGYTASAQSGKVTPITSVNMNQNPMLFYFTVPGKTEEVDVNGTFTDGSTLSAWARFNVGGPTGNLLPTATMLTNGQGVQITSGPEISTTGVYYQQGQIHGYVGITFTTAAQAPTGVNPSFTWIQIINNVGSKVVNTVGQVTVPDNPSTGLDGTYPYFNGTPNGTYDSPGSNLPDMYGELYRTFDATMYLLWDPGLPAGCHTASTSSDGTYTQTPSNCTSIPIPLGSIRWRWNGCAINTLQSQTYGTWTRSCGYQQLYSAQSSGYPEWTATVNPLGN